MAGRLRLPKGPGGKGLGKSPIPPMSKIVQEIIDKLPSIEPPEAAPAKPEEPAHIIVYPDGRLFLATDEVTGKPKISNGEKVFMDTLVNFARRNINKNLPPLAGSEANTDDGKPREESNVLVERLGEDGKRRLWMLVDPKTGQPLRVPQRDPLILSPEEVQKKGLSGMDTSRREGPGFDELMQVMQEFGKDVLGEVLKRLFRTRGTRR